MFCCTRHPQDGALLYAHFMEKKLAQVYRVWKLFQRKKRKNIISRWLAYILRWRHLEDGRGYKDPKKINPCGDAYIVTLAVDILSTVQEFREYETEDLKKKFVLVFTSAPSSKFEKQIETVPIPKKTQCWGVSLHDLCDMSSVIGSQISTVVFSLRVGHAVDFDY